MSVKRERNEKRTKREDRPLNTSDGREVRELNQREKAEITKAKEREMRENEGC